jgi:hypothetical protein
MSDPAISLPVAIDQLLEAVDAYQAKFFPASEEWQPLEVAYNVAKAAASRDGLSLPSLEAAGFQIWKKTAQPPGGFLMLTAFSHDRHEAWLAKVKALRTAAEALHGAKATKADDPKKGEQIAPVSRAIALLMSAKRNGEKVRVLELAKAVGLDKSTLYRDPQFKVVWAAAKLGAKPPTGFKDASGNLDAYGPDDDDDD